LSFSGKFHPAQAGWEQEYIAAVYARSRRYLTDLRDAKRFTTYEAAKAALWSDTEEDKPKE